MDPGGEPTGKTGLAWGIFDPREDIDAALQNGLHKGSATITGSNRKQIKEIAELWFKFYRLCVLEGCMDPDTVEFVSEDFALIPGSHAGGKQGISPVAVLWGVEGYRMGRADEFKGRKASKVHAPPMVLQPANQASTFATASRLKSWGCWVRGREHERSAWKHVALRLKKLKTLR